MKKAKVGVIGCGNICGIYFKAGTTFDILEIVACSDIIPERAEEKAKEFGIPKAVTVKELLNDPEVEIVLNITPPAGHAEMGIAALKAGKHLYNEKPLTIDRKDARKMIELAKQKGLRIGCAPDTFLGAGLQTCRKIIDDGWIGRPVAATGFFMGGGPEGWHPNPEFFFKVGAGPMFDMGPYYLTALVSLLGPVKRVTGSAQISFPKRVATCQQQYGKIIKVETPTHIAGVMDFASGVVGTLITSFDVKAGANLPNLEIYGTEGTLSMPDPNTFAGSVRVRRVGQTEWREVPFSHIYSENSRGIGIADMAYAIRSKRQHRANGDMAYHVLDLMHTFAEASDKGKHIDVSSSCERPKPLPLGLRPGILDD